MEISWEFEGANVEFFKHFARAREIPRVVSPPQEEKLEGKPEEKVSSPILCLPPLPHSLPPPPPINLKPTINITPPLPPGPPPSQNLSRKAAPLPKVMIDPIPVSVSAFKNTSPVVTPLTAIPPPAVSFSIGESGEAKEKPRLRRPRGMSLSGNNTRRSIDSYEKLNQVGGGTYGDVFKARDRETGEIVALKKVRLEGEREGFPVTALREIKFLSQVDHHNIVKLKEVVSSKASDATRGKGSVFMVFDYAESDLVGLMKTTKLSEPHVICLLKQILEALHFAHKNNVLHRDIKPANVLINNQGIVKLADWGLCRRCISGGKYTNRVVTRWYRSPELLLGETQYTSAIDMWAVGCLMAELIMGRALLPGKDEANQLKMIFELCGTQDWPKSWESLPLAEELKNMQNNTPQKDVRFQNLRPVAKDLLDRLLSLDPAKRITASEALDHDYFWSKDVVGCQPNMLPRPRGDGVHEYQLREEEKRAHIARQQYHEANKQIHHQEPTRQVFHDSRQHEYHQKKHS